MLTAEPPHPPKQASTLLAGPTPRLSVRTL